ncbi:MAG: hypothetical protein CVU91_07035 [Firmicutes bacterium HGW-Firmicutes-16]|nr:MAG: hypothetical protein CVU91_07035 [Firmicutes bacterium HGW-Firmicutes-16]
MCCEKCNSQTVEDSDFCPEDGVTQNSDSSNYVEKARMPLCKKWWVWTIAGVTLIAGIAAVLSYRKDRQIFSKLLDLIEK